MTVKLIEEAALVDSLRTVLREVYDRADAAAARRHRELLATLRELAGTKPAVSGGLLSVKETAAMIGLSARTVWKLLAMHQFPQPIRHGRRIVKWKVEDVQAWIADGKGKPSAGPFAH